METLARRKVLQGGAALAIGALTTGAEAEGTKKKRGTVRPITPDRSLETLSFVTDYWVRPVGKRRGEAFRCFWAVSLSGHYAADCKQGGEMAREFLGFLC